MHTFPQYLPPPRRTPKPNHKPLAAALLVATVVTVVAAGAVAYNDPAARSTVDAAHPAALPGPLPVESVPGDGTWLVGSEVQPGTYQSTGGDSCYWSRLRDLSGELSAIVANGYRVGPQVVTIAGPDAAFVSQGCGSWVMVR